MKPSINMTWAKDPGIHVLATAVIAGTPSAGAHKGEVVPQIWTYEHTLPAASPPAPLSGCRDTYANFTNSRCSRCCCAASPGPPKSPWTR